jgi:hypothetical protein
MASWLGFGKKPIAIAPLNASKIGNINAKTQNFKNALTAYKAAITNLNTNSNIYAKLNKENENGIKYNKKLLNSIAKAFYQGRKAAEAVSELQPGGPEAPAANEVNAAARAVNEVAAQIVELNKAMSSYTKLNNKNVNAYIASGRNASANNVLNKKRNEGGKYTNFFTKVAARQVAKSALAKAASLNK